jgi:TP901 family phage tail tape measure protein
MQVRIVGTANTAQARAQFAALTAQVAALNAEMNRASMVPKGGSAQGFNQISRGAASATRAWNSAMAASGAYRVEQIKINDAVSHHTELLQRQKLGFNQVFGKKARGMMREVYREQLRIQNSQLMMPTGGIGNGKTVKASMAIPTNVLKSWDTASARIGFFRQRLASSSKELINWGKNTQWAGRQLMAGISMPVAAFGAAAGIMAYKVDKAMAQITKVYDFSAAAQLDSAQREKEAGQLRVDSLKNAREAAVQYGAQISKTLDVEQQLAATGLSGDNLLKTTNQVQRISTLGDIDPSQTTDMVVALQTAFRDTIRDGDDLNNTLNFMNAASNATSLSLQDIAEATPRAASALSSLGVDAKEMTVLLVSMRESGVNAAEGANALKSASTRILNPVKKAVALYDQYGISIKSISEQSGGNLFEFLKLLGKEQQKINGSTEKQTKYLRAQGIATLFGTYQYNRLNASLVNLGDAYGGVQNQSKKAIDLMGLSTEELAKRADNSMKDITQTASGRFRKSLETMKADLAALGQPFLEVATVMVKAISSLFGLINSMPSAAKKGLIFSLMLAAIVGPVVMLIGLFANFAGNIGNFAAFLMRAATSWRMMDKAQWAAKVSADLAAKGFQNEMSESQQLTAQIKAQTAAFEAMAVSMAAVGKITLPPGVLSTTGAPAPGTVGRPPSTSTNGPHGGFVQAPAYVPPTISRLPNGQTETAAQLEQRAAIAEREALARQAGLQAAARTANAQTILSQRSAETTRSLNGAALATGAMGIAMAGMMLTSGATEGSWKSYVNEASKFVLIAAILVPAVKAMALWASAAAAATSKWAVELVFATYDYVLLNTEAAAQVGLLGAMTVGAVGFGKALNAAMGPIGWIVLGLTAAAATLFFIHKHNKAIEEAQKRQLDNQAGLVSETQEWAKAQTDAVDSWRKFQDLQLSTKQKTQMDTDVAYYTSDPQKDKTASFNTISGVEQDNILMLKYVNSIKSVGLSAVEAKNKLTAFLFATGMSLDQANARAAQLSAQLGDLSKLDANGWIGEFSKTADSVISSVADGNLPAAKSFGEQAAALFREGFTDPANTPKDRKEIYNALKTKVMDPWDAVVEKIKTNGQGLSFVGVNEEDLKSGEALRNKYLNTAVKDRDKFLSAMYPDGSGATNMFAEDAKGANDIEVSLVGAAGSAMNMAADVDHLGEFLNDPRMSAMTKTFTEAQDEVEALRTKMAGIGAASKEQASIIGGIFGSSDADIESSANHMAELQIATAATDQAALNAAFGFKTASDNLSPADQYSQNLAYWMNKTKVETAGAVKMAAALKKELNGLQNTIAVNITMENTTNLLKTGMQNVQSSFADVVMGDFDKRMDANLKSKADYWETRINNLQDQQEKASKRLDDRQQAEQDRFDRRWERRTKAVEDAYQGRIDKVNDEIKAEQKADEIRQKIFEAEKTRLERLTEIANRGIDFNMAIQTGNLDEAAKIRNDMDAAAQDWALSDAGAAGADKSQARQDALGVKADNLGKKKDAALEALKKREDAERKSMEKRQQMEKDNLKKIQEMNAKALDKLSQLRQDNAKTEWDIRKDSLQKQLDTFKAFVPKNQKQLEKWMKEMDLSYAAFGKTSLLPKAQEWGGWYKKSLKDGIRTAGLESASDGMWAKLGGDMAKSTLNGMGFTLGSFKKFIATGQLPDNFGKPIVKKPQMRPSDIPRGRPGEDTMPTAHTGGWIDGGAGSRKGVARTLKGLHPSEQMTRTRAGEFVVNEHSAKKYAPHLEAMNKGTFNDNVSLGGAGAKPMGFAGLIAGAIGPAFAMGIASTLQNAVVSKYQGAQEAFTGSFSPGKAGTYGGVNFDAEQLANAAIIAGVGKSMGMSVRDIEIGIMTAITESMLRNIQGGDRDSQGLFQQRPSQGWGTPAQVTDPQYAARKFFEALKGVGNRATMKPWMAAQSVQRSAFSDGSNYRGYWDEGMAIFNGLSDNQGNLALGPGGKHKPIGVPESRGLHDEWTGYPAVDFAARVGAPVFAVGDGVITRSYDIPGPLASDSYRGDGPYGSYGKVMYLKTDAGPEVLYAHLSDRNYEEGQRVTGGTIIGRSGNTGNSSGPHLHFGAKGASPLAFLKSGGMTLNDGMAMLHRGETVLTDDLTNDLKDTVRAFGKSSREILSGRRGGNRDAQLQDAQAFARRQVGKPYIWGGVGPEGFDCSGIQSAIVNVIKGNDPFHRLFATGSMAGVIPSLGFKKGNGGRNDYSVGWRTGNPGHTSGRIGDMGIESTGNAVRSKGATPVGAFPNQWHLPLTSIAAQTSVNPENIDTRGKDKTPVIPWTKKDGFSAASESWKQQSVKADPFSSEFWTYANTVPTTAVADTLAKAAGSMAPISDSGNGAGLKIGTLNTWVKSSASATEADLERLLPGTDFLALTEMGHKFAQTKKWLAERNWGLLGGRGRDQTMSAMAYNKDTEILEKQGIRKLGDKKADVIGGRELRYANYGLFTDKQTGRKTWQVAAHTVPAGRGLNAKNGPLYKEQWGNLNALVDELQSSGAPVFLSGDLNVHQSRSNFQTPGSLDEYAASDVDYVFGDKKLSKLMRQQLIKGMHTDHAGALMSQFSIPSHKDGAQNIKFDNTLANLHRGEGVLTESQNTKFRNLADNIDNVAGGRGNEYNINVNVNNPAADANEIATVVLRAIQKTEARKPTRRRS